MFIARIDYFVFGFFSPTLTTLRPCYAIFCWFSLLLKSVRERTWGETPFELGCLVGITDDEREEVPSPSELELDDAEAGFGLVAFSLFAALALFRRLSASLASDDSDLCVNKFSCEFSR